MDRVGVLVIGRNEGERLRRCLAWAGDDQAPRVYVDSGSSDGSTGLARSMGWDVVELDPSLPFSAARGRNAGFRHLMGANPHVEFVQFVDRDWELCREWLERAVGELEAQPTFSVLATADLARRGVDAMPPWEQALEAYLAQRK